MNARFEFGPFAVDPANQRLLEQGQPVAVTPKVFEVLVLLLRHHGRLMDKQELMAQLWPDAFVEDVTLARHVSDLRKALKDDAGAPRYVETVPKRGYRFIGAVRVMQPDVGPAPAANAPAAQSALPAAAPALLPSRAAGWSRRSAVAVSIVALAIVGGAFLAVDGRFSSRREVPSMIRSMAILPFSAAGDAGASELGTMLADALVLRLHRLPGITVRSTRAVASFEAGRQEPGAFGEAVRVDAVVYGTLLQSRGRLRLNVTMLRVADRSVVWAEQFEETATDLFAIEDSIATRVVGALAVSLPTEARRNVSQRGTDVAAAHEAFLRGRYYWNRRSPDTLAKATALHEEAVRLDPTYALAHAALADDYAALSGYHLTSQHEMIPKARTAARTALALDSNLAEAYTTLALIAMNYDWAWEEADRLYLKAIELNPYYATAHAWRGEYLAYMGRFDEGLAELRRGQELDPLSTIIATDVGKALFLARRYDEAIGHVQAILQIEPNFAPARLWISASYFHSGQFEKFRAAVDARGLPDQDPARFVDLIAHYGATSRPELVAKHLDMLVTVSRKTFVSPFFMAQAYQHAGDLDRGFEWLDRMCDERSPGIIGFKIDPMFDRFRADPRFVQVLRRVGFVK